jgi:hypothetical protein
MPRHAIPLYFAIVHSHCVVRATPLGLIAARQFFVLSTLIFSTTYLIPSTAIARSAHSQSGRENESMFNATFIGGKNL